jgi:hypothetical protein
LSNACIGWPSSSITYWVTSTRKLIGRTPLRRRRSAIHTGVGAVASTPSMTRPTKRGTFAPASSSTARDAASLPAQAPAAIVQRLDTALPQRRGHIERQAAHRRSSRRGSA